MKAKFFLPLLLGLNGMAEAALFDRGNGLLYDSDRNLTWMANANLFKTQANASGDSAAYVQSIIDANNGLINDGQSLRHLDTGDFNAATGKMSWFGAQAWTNSLVYGGYSDWRLPSIVDTGRQGCEFTDCGYNVDTSSSELAHMYYDNLGRKSVYSSSRVYQPDYGIYGNGTSNGVDQSSLGQTDIGMVTNLQAGMYWTDKAVPSLDLMSGAWVFDTVYGTQSDNFGLVYDFFAWAVRSGDVDFSGTLNWQDTGGANTWDAFANWDRGFAPATTTDVVIDPSSGPSVMLTVNGPQHDASINSLTLGSRANLQLQSGHEFVLASDNRATPHVSSNHGIIDNWGTLTLGNVGETVDGGTIVENLAVVSRYGYIMGASILNDGVLSNHATLVNGSASAGAEFNAATSLNNGNLLSNYGNLNNYASIVNNNTVDNYGVISNAGSIETQRMFNNYGTLSNDGQLTNYGNMRNHGLLSNAGTISNMRSFANDTDGIINSTGRIGNWDNFINGGQITMGNGARLYNLHLFTNVGQVVVNNGASILDRLLGEDQGTGRYIQIDGSTVVNGFMIQPLIDIQAGSLSGSGQVYGYVNIGAQASLNPGNSPGTLNITGNLDISGILNIQVAGLTSGLFDVLNVSGKTTFLAGSKVLFDFIDGYQPTDDFNISFLNSNDVDFSLASFGFINPDFQNSHYWQVALGPGGGLQLTVNSIPTDVPLPSTAWLFGSSLLGLLGLKNRRKLESLS